MQIVKKGFPAEGEIVVCSILNVYPYYAFAELTEYEKKEGMIHVSEISSKWIKNIRDYVKEGKRVVCKVLSVDKEKDHINLSLRRVSSGQQKAKLDEMSRRMKAEKLLELAAKNFDMDLVSAFSSVGEKLESHFGELFFAFEDASINGVTALKKVKIPKDWKDIITDIAKKNIVPPVVVIKGTLTLSSKEPEGLSSIQNALNAAATLGGKNDIEIEVYTISAPKYRLKVTAPDYKTAEDVMKKAAKKAIDTIIKEKGSGEFKRK